MKKKQILFFTVSFLIIIIVILNNNDLFNKDLFKMDKKISRYESDKFGVSFDYPSFWIQHALPEDTYVSVDYNYSIGFFSIQTASAPEQEIGYMLQHKLAPLAGGYNTTNLTIDGQRALILTKLDSNEATIYFQSEGPIVECPLYHFYGYTADYVSIQTTKEYLDLIIDSMEIFKPNRGVCYDAERDWNKKNEPQLEQKSYDNPFFGLYFNYPEQLQIYSLNGNFDLYNSAHREADIEVQRNRNLLQANQNIIIIDLIESWNFESALQEIYGPVEVKYHEQKIILKENHPKVAVLGPDEMGVSLIIVEVAAPIIKSGGAYNLVGIFVKDEYALEIASSIYMYVPCWDDCPKLEISEEKDFDYSVEIVINATDKDTGEQLKIGGYDANIGNFRECCGFSKGVEFPDYLSTTFHSPLTFPDERILMDIDVKNEGYVSQKIVVNLMEAPVISKEENVIKKQVKLDVKLIKEENSVS